ncbi:MAG: 3-deoxy-7-phosphoheptulonate synthase [Planctomycetota bacterium]
MASADSANRVQDLHIQGLAPLTCPAEVKTRIPATEKATQTVIRDRDALKKILLGQDDRLVAIVGPCSIHDPHAALDYARKLAEVADRVRDRILVIMRVYFEKPRTTTGWKGLIYDPHLNDTFDMEAGITSARELLIQINDLGLSAATEFLDPFVPQYIAGLITWAAIGARTTESQTHRQMASGLSMPVGFKNSTAGDLEVAANAMLSAQTPHAFLGIDPHGAACVVHTAGNRWGHAILRGGADKPNYDATSISHAVAILEKAGVNPKVMIDCSHANSYKKHENQIAVFNSAIEQRANGNDHIFGVMLESNLHPGAQKLTEDLEALKYGVSITDACIGWEQTEQLLLDAYEELGG